MNRLSIDLHGLTEEEAIRKIEMFLMTFEESGYDEAEIITGNGIVLKDVATEIVGKRGYSYYHEGNNQGAIIIKK